MLFRKKLVPFLTAASLLISLTAACADSGSGDAGGTSAIPGTASVSSKETASEPLTLSFYVSSLNLTNTEFKLLIADPVHKKYPNITVERIIPPQGVDLAKLVATNEIPDIIYAAVTSYYSFKKLGLLQDLGEFIEKNDFDLNRIKPEILQTIKNYTPEGTIFTLPFNDNDAILYYNKDIFDKFGVPYPPDEQMTWEETLELAKKLTRKENGVQYIGLDTASGPGHLESSLALGLLNPETGEASVNTPEWKKVLSFLKKTFEVPGYIQGDRYLYDREAFLTERILAMRPTYLANMIGNLEELRQQGNPMNWDIAPIPNFEEALGTSKEVNIHSLFISSQSKHKEEAFKVIEHILSDEVQLILSKNGRLPSIDNPEIERQFGADVEELKDKKIENVFKAKSVLLHKPHEFESDVSALWTETKKDVALNGTDENTALRQLEESINKKIETLNKTR